MSIDWKRYAITGASFGVALAVALIAAAGLFYWYSSRPPSWDSSSIKGISTTVSQTFNLEEQQKQFTASGFTMAFILENTSRKDYTVPQDLRIFERSTKTRALEEFKAKLDHPFVVPANEKTEVTAHIEYGCSEEDMGTSRMTERDGSTCFKDAFGSVAEFVGFDDTTHTRLNLPKPIFYVGSPQPKEADKGMAPDRGKPWERYGACEQAAKLVPVCKQKGIALEDAKAAAGGWTPVGPLPTIAPLPKGFTLDAGDFGPVRLLSARWGVRTGARSQLLQHRCVRLQGISPQRVPAPAVPCGSLQLVQSSSVRESFKRKRHREQRFHGNFRFQKSTPHPSVRTEVVLLVVWQSSAGASPRISLWRLV